MINRDANPEEGAAIELAFRRAVEGEMKYYRLRRSWQDTPKDIVDKVEVFDDSNLDADLSEHWDEFIEGYIPSGIAHLFFFDAEQIKELAEGEHAAEILGGSDPQSAGAGSRGPAGNRPDCAGKAQAGGIANDGGNGAHQASRARQGKGSSICSRRPGRRVLG